MYQASELSDAVECLVPGCNRLFATTDPDMDRTTRGALPKSDIRSATATFRNARERWELRCRACDKRLPKSLTTQKFEFVGSTDARARWDAVLLTFEDARWLAERRNDKYPETLSEAQEAFLTQTHIQCAIAECSRPHMYDDPLVDLTTKGAVPTISMNDPMSWGTSSDMRDSDDQAVCILPDCLRRFSLADVPADASIEREADVDKRYEARREWEQARFHQACGRLETDMLDSFVRQGWRVTKRDDGYTLE